MKSSVYPHLEIDSEDYKLLHDLMFDNWRNLLGVNALEVRFEDGSTKLLKYSHDVYLIDVSNVVKVKAI